CVSQDRRRFPIDGTQPLKQRFGIHFLRRSLTGSNRRCDMVFLVTDGLPLRKSCGEDATDSEFVLVLRPRRVCPQHRSFFGSDRKGKRIFWLLWLLKS